MRNAIGFQNSEQNGAFYGHRKTHIVFVLVVVLVRCKTLLALQLRAGNPNCNESSRGIRCRHFLLHFWPSWFSRRPQAKVSPSLQYELTLIAHLYNMCVICAIASTWTWKSRDSVSDFKSFKSGTRLSIACYKRRLLKARKSLESCSDCSLFLSDTGRRLRILLAVVFCNFNWFSFSAWWLM